MSAMGCNKIPNSWLSLAQPICSGGGCLCEETAGAMVVAKHATSHSTEASVHTRDRASCTTDNRAPFPVHHTHTSDFLGVGPLGRFNIIRHRFSLRSVRPTPSQPSRCTIQSMRATYGGHNGLISQKKSEKCARGRDQKFCTAPSL